MSSPRFAARRTAGVCWFCVENRAADARIVQGQTVYFLTAPAAERGPSARPMTPAEESQLRTFVAERQAARRERRPEPQAPAWLWEQVVHVSCAQAAGFGRPRRATVARDGARTVGHAHGARNGAAVAPVAVAAVVAPEQVAQAIEAAERRTVNGFVALWPAQAAPVAPVAPTPAAPAPEAPKGLEDVAHIVERFKRIEIDGDNTPVAAPGSADVAHIVERFKRLDLD